MKLTILRYDTAAAKTTGSVVKTDTMGPAHKNVKTDAPARARLDMVDPLRAANRALASLPAPSHWPTTVAAAAPNPSVMTKARLSTRWPSPSAARFASPKPRRILPSTMYTAVNANPAPAMGPPMLAMRRMAFRFGLRKPRSTPCFRSALIDSTRAIQLDVCVAIAAPATPIAGMKPGTPQMNNGSSTALMQTQSVVTPSTGRIDPIPLKPAATIPEAIKGSDPINDHLK
mmetsp:Transcript_7723/g.29011  ORF Transcript_7723/g.29011 Transcript_7723/m.29011 type:complete len:230 (+) Transcript_7723:409-1098(+)